MTAEYTVKLNIFEGPLDLLLHLIKVNELEITEVSISQITSQYLDTLRLMETLDPGDRGGLPGHGRLVAQHQVALDPGPSRRARWRRIRSKRGMTS